MRPGLRIVFSRAMAVNMPKTAKRGKDERDGDRDHHRREGLAFRRRTHELWLALSKRHAYATKRYRLQRQKGPKDGADSGPGPGLVLSAGRSRATREGPRPAFSQSAWAEVATQPRENPSCQTETDQDLGDALVPRRRFPPPHERANLSSRPRLLIMCIEVSSGEGLLASGGLPAPGRPERAQL